MSTGILYLLPAPLDPEGFAALPENISGSIRDCRIFFVENERTTRRFFKQLWRQRHPGEEMRIEDYEWVRVDDAQAPALLRDALSAGKNCGIVSEAGCPGIADPGQALVALAHNLHATIKPLTGPNSLLLALMASGMNGQQFRFWGYLPVEAQQRARAITEMETASAKAQGTQLCIETPYRNNQLLEAFLRYCKPGTRLCIAANLTGNGEYIRTQTIAGWKKQPPDLHKQPVIFCLDAGQ